MRGGRCERALAVVIGGGLPIFLAVPGFAAEGPMGKHSGRPLAAIVVLLALAILGGAPATAQTLPGFVVDPGRAPVSTAALVAASADTDDGFWLAVRIRLADGWHTYWRNPGDAGAPSEVVWTLPAGLAAGPLLWPAPEVIREGSFITFGYEHEAWLLTRVTGASAVAKGAEIGADVHWLVCADICVPQSASLSLTLADDGAPSVEDTRGLERAVALLPAASPGPVAAAIDGDEIRLSVGGLSPDITADTAIHFFPHDFGVIDLAAAQTASIADDGVTLSLRRDRSTGMAPDGLAGTLVLRGPDGVRAYDVESPLTVTGDRR